MDEITEFVDENKLREMFNILDQQYGYDTKGIQMELNRELEDKFAMLVLNRDTLEPLRFVFCLPSLCIRDESYLWEVVKHEYAHYIDICINKSSIEDSHGISFRELANELGFWVITEEDSEKLLKLIMSDYKLYLIEQLENEYFN